MEICIDNGGTLTDFCVLQADKIWATKTLTTPYDLSQCFFDGLKKISTQIYGDEDVARLLAESSSIKYSTTQGTNSLVERKGPKLGLVVLKDFDVAGLTASDHHKQLFNALIGDRVIAVDMNLQGTALADEIIRCTNALGGQGASRIVLCFTGLDYARQERRYVAVYQHCFRSHDLGTVPVSTSHETVGDAVDLRRMWTTILNAFLHGPMENFLFYAQQRLKAYRGAPTLRILRNDGGTAKVVKTTAVKTYSSGPRGGMEAARRIAARRGYDHVLSVDVGGTTSDIGRVEQAEIHTDLRGDIEGVQSSLELCGVVSAGVGGGSLIRMMDGVIKVGPESAGAAPGPACFGLGGTDATVTDAVLATGLLDPDTFFDGGKSLDRGRAGAAIKAHVADPLGVTVAEAAHLMRAAWAKALATAIHECSTPRADSVLLAFGGAGPMAICEVAEELGVRKVYVPKFAAMLSAYGVSFSRASQDYEVVVPQSDQKVFKRLSDALLQRAATDMATEGLELGECRLQARAITGDDVADIDVHAPGKWPARIDSVQLRVSSAVKFADVDVDAQQVSAKKPSRQAGKQCPEVDQRGVINADGAQRSLPVYKTFDLEPDAWAAGPAVLEGLFYTGYLPEHWVLHVVEDGDLLLVNEAQH